MKDGDYAGVTYLSLLLCRLAFSTQLAFISLRFWQCSADGGVVLWVIWEQCAMINIPARAHGYRGTKTQRRPRAWSRTFEATFFFRTTASFEEGNMAKRQKLEPEFEEVSELYGPFLKAKVHCVVISVSSRARVIVSTSRSLVERRSSVARHLILSTPNVRQRVRNAG